MKSAINILVPGFDPRFQTFSASPKNRKNKQLFEHFCISNIFYLSWLEQDTFTEAMLTNLRNEVVPSLILVFSYILVNGISHLYEFTLYWQERDTFTEALLTISLSST